jgi:hypothetical protein
MSAEPTFRKPRNMGHPADSACDAGVRAALRVRKLENVPSVLISRYTSIVSAISHVSKTAKRGAPGWALSPAFSQKFMFTRMHK